MNPVPTAVCEHLTDPVPPTTSGPPGELVTPTVVEAISADVHAEETVAPSIVEALVDPVPQPVVDTTAADVPLVEPVSPSVAETPPAAVPKKRRKTNEPTTATRASERIRQSPEKPQSVISSSESSSDEESEVDKTFFYPNLCLYDDDTGLTYFKF